MKQKAKELVNLYGSKVSALLFTKMLIFEIEQSVKYIKMNREDRQTIDDNLNYWHEVEKHIKNTK